ncbi:hypothetical protein [Kamptonema formosum]|uniref:hypothetical protein n=1 Tax=Kamptonema formosum TaxID=331992 RepID=UPI00034957B4|nr:hypothetical protein [Oscillatoria sp. PCC 10802]
MVTIHFIANLKAFDAGVPAVRGCAAGRRPVSGGAGCGLAGAGLALAGGQSVGFKNEPPP